MKEKKDNAYWAKLRDELLDKFQTSTKETNFEVELEEVERDGEKVLTGFDIYPAKTVHGGTFYAIEDLGRFCEYHGLSCWADVASHNGGLCVRIHVY